ncbi:MAG TPA: rRNA pseudouridine synthase [Candidatus Faecousia intestinigallinarum]|nr:rRNA pseudouridine synthase [Candidatus Faecousia intestinigallinarum]
MKERLQKIIAARGIASRRKAEEWIAAGRVSCNGQVCRLGDLADPDTDHIFLDGKPLPAPQGGLYIMLNKPRGYVTTLSDEKGRRTAAELVADCGARVYPVGRLDLDSEGLLLFTNDGAFAHYLMHPSHTVKKIYRVWVRGYTPAALRALRAPMVLDGYRLHPAGVKLLSQENDRALLQVVIHEGRNRQVRRMCTAVGMEVTRLQRVGEGKLRLGTLEVGKWRHLTQKEIAALRQEGEISDCHKGAAAARKK